MKRNKFSLSHYKLATFDMAELVPVGVWEVLAGDSFRHATSALIRVSPLVAPVMHPIQVRLHHWFVPYRLLWTGWEDFITGGTDGLGDGVGSLPTITAAGAAGGLADYFGLEPGVSLSVNALPFRAYSLIWNEMYRDQDLQTARAISVAGGSDSTTDTTLAKISWEKDYFTTARPWSQRGPAVSLPLGTTAPVKGLGINTGASTASSQSAVGVNSGEDWTSQPSFGTGLLARAQSNAVPSSSNRPQIYADLSGATAAQVNDVRRAFALQRYAEARARYGARYTEYLRYLGVKSSDARLQRPEYLGGGKQTISFSEVLQTAEGTAAVGTMRGHGISAVRSRPYVRFFEEHGVVMTLASVRPKTMYGNATHRMWLRSTKEDFWQKELENIGQQPIWNAEVYANAAVKKGTFGYQDRYDEYRRMPSTIAGDFRTSTMNAWHMARLFGSEPTLNSAFVTADPTKRIHAVSTNDVLWCLFNHSVQARRLVGQRGGAVL